MKHFKLFALVAVVSICLYSVVMAQNEGEKKDTSPPPPPPNMPQDWQADVLITTQFNPKVSNVTVPPVVGHMYWSVTEGAKRMDFMKPNSTDVAMSVLSLYREQPPASVLVMRDIRKCERGGLNGTITPLFEWLQHNKTVYAGLATYKDKFSCHVYALSPFEDVLLSGCFRVESREPVWTAYQDGIGRSEISFRNFHAEVPKDTFTVPEYCAAKAATADKTAQVRDVDVDDFLLADAMDLHRYSANTADDTRAQLYDVDVDALDSDGYSATAAETAVGDVDEMDTDEYQALLEDSQGEAATSATSDSSGSGSDDTDADELAADDTVDSANGSLADEDSSTDGEHTQLADTDPAWSMPHGMIALEARLSSLATTAAKAMSSASDSESDGYLLH